MYTNAHYALDQVINQKVRELVSERHGSKAAQELDYELVFSKSIVIERNDRFFADEVSEVVEFFNAEFEDSFEFFNAAKALGAIGGSVTSKAKSIAAKENGKLGGRPKKAK